MPTALVTGANRGLGLLYCRQLLDAGWSVHGCCRNPSKALELSLLKDGGADLRVHQLDVTNHDNINTLASKLAGVPVDLLINNAGTYGPEAAVPGQAYQSVANMDYGIWREILEVNVLSLFKVTTALLANVALSDRKLIVNLSSDLGSIANNTRGQSHAYRTSKAAVNMITVSLARELADQQITVVSMAPGWCTTDMGGPEGQVDPEESVRAQVPLFERLGPEDSSRFIDRFGNDVAW